MAGTASCPRPSRGWRIPRREGMQSKPWGCLLDPAKETEGVAVDMDMAGEMQQLS